MRGVAWGGMGSNHVLLGHTQVYAWSDVGHVKFEFCALVPHTGVRVEGPEDAEPLPSG